MNSELLVRLMQADPAERQWLLLESVLELLSVEVRQAVWAVAVPHWFDDRILADLCPELANQATEIYQELQALSFVEIFEGRGHNIHEATRSILLDRLWNDRADDFKSISARAAEYFESDAENVAEWLYHKAIGGTIGDALDDVMQPLEHNYRRSELEVILKGLDEQIKANRIDTKVDAKVSYWHSRLHQQLYQSNSILARTKFSISMCFSEINLLKLIIQILSWVGMFFAGITLSYAVNQAPNILSLGLIWGEIARLLIGIFCIIIALGLFSVVYRNRKNESSSLSQQRYGSFVTASKIVIKFASMGFLGFMLSTLLLALFGQVSSVVLLERIWVASWKPIAALVLTLVMLASIEELCSPQHRSTTRSMLAAIEDSIFPRRWKHPHRNLRQSKRTLPPRNRRNQPSQTRIQKTHRK